jgi:prepilin-type N-terminal cleavage/methylation domain-containing protein
MRRRKGFSLVELSVVIAILALLSALTISAVQKVRAHSLRNVDRNHLKQIGLATNGYISLHQGMLPSTHSIPPVSLSEFPKDQLGLYPTSPHFNILPMLGDAPAPYFKYNPKTDLDLRFYRIRTYISPTDISLKNFDLKSAKHITICYPMNALALLGTKKSSDISDGFSNTVLASQHYFGWYSGEIPTYYEYGYAYPGVPSTAEFLGTKPALFADANYKDIVPIRAIDGSTQPSSAGMTFQVSPKLIEADGKRLHSTNSSDLLLLSFDGSVSSCSSTISPSVYWSRITPNWNDLTE